MGANTNAERENGLFDPLRLPCWVTLKNRIVKPAMPDSLRDGAGHPTDTLFRLYRRRGEGRIGDVHHWRGAVKPVLCGETGKPRVG